MLNSIVYFFKEHHYNILTSVTNVKSVEYVAIGDSYKKIELPENPFILKMGDGRSFTGIQSSNSKKIQFYLPIVPEPVSQYRGMSYNEYRFSREHNMAVGYLRVGDSDRLKLSSWIKAERNIRYDVYDYDDLSLISKKCLFQKVTPYQKKKLKAT